MKRPILLFLSSALASCADPRCDGFPAEFERLEVPKPEFRAAKTRPSAALIETIKNCYDRNLYKGLEEIEFREAVVRKNGEEYYTFDLPGMTDVRLMFLTKNGRVTGAFYYSTY